MSLEVRQMRHVLALVLATGGTLDASVVLCRRAGYAVHGIGVLLDIGLVPGYRCGDFTPRSVIRYG